MSFQQRVFLTNPPPLPRTHTSQDTHVYFIGGGGIWEEILKNAPKLEQYTKTQENVDPPPAFA